MRRDIELLRPQIKGVAWWIAASAAGFLAAALVATDAYQLRQAAAETELRLQKLRAERSHAKKTPPLSSQEERKKWETLRAEMAFPWPKVFQAIERSNDPEIELFEFEPDRRSLSMRLRGEAKDVPSLLRYMKTLSTQPIARKVYLVNQEPVTRNRLQTVSFELQMIIR